MRGSRGKNYSKCMENSAAIDPYNCTITRWILTKNVSLKDNDTEIISSKQEEEFKATTFVVNILKLHINPKVLIQEFVGSFEILIPNVFRHDLFFLF